MYNMYMGSCRRGVLGHRGAETRNLGFYQTTQKYFSFFLTRGRPKDHVLSQTILQFIIRDSTLIIYYSIHT